MQSHRQYKCVETQADVYSSPEQGEPSFLVYMGILDPTTEAVTSNGTQLEGAMSGVFQVQACSQNCDSDNFG